MGERVDWFNLTVQRVHGVSVDWKWSRWNQIDKPEDYMTLEGAVPVGVFKSGKRKGRTKWPKERQTFWVRERDVEETRRLWEEETGRCAYCVGTGQTVASVGVSGTTYRTCIKCNGTKLATAQPGRRGA